MNATRFFAVACIAFLFSCQKKEEKRFVVSEQLIDHFDFTKDAVFDTLSVPPHLRKTVADISALNIYETKQGGKGAIEPPANFKNFTKLFDTASESELLALTDNKNNAVAVYAAIGLQEKNNRYTVPVFQKMLNRKGKVHIQDGCIISEDHPAEPVYWNHYYKLESKELKSDSGLKQLDSMLLFMPDSSELILTTALRNRTYSEGLKKQIAKQAFEHHRVSALLYINSWHKKEYATALQKELLGLIKNDSLDTDHKRYYLSELLSFNNIENKKAILNYLKKDSSWKEDDKILSQMENNGISAEDYK